MPESLGYGFPSESFRHTKLGKRMSNCVLGSAEIIRFPRLLVHHYCFADKYELPALSVRDVFSP